MLKVIVHQTSPNSSDPLSRLFYSFQSKKTKILPYPNCIIQTPGIPSGSGRLAAKKGIETASQCISKDDAPSKDLKRMNMLAKRAFLEH